MLETGEKPHRATGRYVAVALGLLYVIGFLCCLVIGVRGSDKSDISVMSSAFWHPPAPE
ncbi:MAG: hypothetical protein KGQ47_04210 [Hyphomicrobiales bacterium]|nr:hypothetical protein [Hyphomicrobiales bacterium]